MLGFVEAVGAVGREGEFSEGREERQREVERG